ncbi:hypothetical protein Pan181_50880 [Aeoliella mucimassa]|uniref:Lipoprotein n=2 Tax=Aeoliella mucimassa TaxID=2527972 RepID=A0A518AVW2_9BACT|nr:hypothetical protein Pan181_50880 [Aeoliella mucimassa]
MRQRMTLVAAITLAALTGMLTTRAGAEEAAATPIAKQAAPAEKPITLEELNRRQVIGKLGMPLGTCVEIQAQVVANPTPNKGAYDHDYLLNVTHANGKLLPQSQLIEFRSLRHADSRLVNDSFRLYEMKTGQKARSLNSEQIAELEKGYVGKVVHLAAYETGSFSGIPRNLPSEVPIWQGRGYHFRSSLIVIVDRDAEQARNTKREMMLRKGS